MYIALGEDLKPILLIVDIMSRKSWAYVLSGSGDRFEKILIHYKKCLSEVDNINGIEGDAEFNNKQIKEFNESKNINQI